MQCNMISMHLPMFILFQAFYSRHIVPIILINAHHLMQLSIKHLCILLQASQYRIVQYSIEFHLCYRINTFYVYCFPHFFFASPFIYLVLAFYSFHCIMSIFFYASLFYSFIYIFLVICIPSYTSHTLHLILRI